MAGRIKITIDRNGAVDMDLSNLKKCSDQTKAITEALDLTDTDIRMKEESVETVSVNHQRVHRK